MQEKQHNTDGEGPEESPSLPQLVLTDLADMLQRHYPCMDMPPEEQKAYWRERKAARERREALFVKKLFARERCQGEP